MNLPSKNLERLFGMLLAEVIRADISMHDAQVDAWRAFSELKTRTTPLNPDLFTDWAGDRYLFVKELTMKFNIRPMPVTFWQRLKQAFRYVRGKDPVFASTPLELSPPGTDGSFEVTITVTRREDGVVDFSYTPANATLKDIFAADPFLKSVSTGP